MRGALMLTMSINHPDAEQFIDIKLSAGKVTGANISIKITDEFMECVMEGRNFIQYYPVTEDIGSIVPIESLEDCKLDEVYESPLRPGGFFKVINAKRLWDKIVSNAHRSAEPGVLFWSTVLRESIPDCYSDLGFKTVSTNPCFTGETLILTDKGYVPIESLSYSGNPFTSKDALPRIINEFGNAVPGKVWSNGFKHIIRLAFNNQSYIECTPDHKFKLSDGSECEARSLIGRIVKGFDGNDQVVTNISDEGKIKEVFDFNLQEGDNHWGVVGGMIVHNCGEIPLCPDDSCRLISLNLYSYVDNPFTKEASFNFDKFRQHAKYVARIMDDIIDLESEKIDEIINKVANDPEPEDIKRFESELWKKIKKKTLEGRRTGIGITAEGDMLAALGIQYGSEKCIDFCEKVHEVLATKIYEESINLASERGAFPVWDPKKELGAPFLERIFSSDEFDEKYLDLYNKVGRRNIAGLTIAPNGSLSIQSQTSSGIEPVFSAFYKRRKKTTDKSLATFTDAGDMYEEYNVFHPKFADWYRIVVSPGLSFEDAIEKLSTLSDEEIQTLYEQSPYFKSSAQDIDWVSKVKMQGRIQKWVDHSISCTVNLPEDTTVETVSDVYLTAYESGCKGRCNALIKLI
jgi:Ribonucleotide reductase, alpha subunit